MKDKKESKGEQERGDKYNREKIYGMKKKR